MPLYDAYGRPIPRAPDTTPPVSSKPKSLLRKYLERTTALFRGINKTLKLAIEFLGVLVALLTLFWAVLEFRQDVSVVPYISFDSAEAFQQQFTITNNGPFDIYDVHLFLCGDVHAHE